MLLMLLLPIGLFAQTADRPLQLSLLIEEALAQNPDLQSAQNTWQAQVATVPQAGALPDPVLSFNLLNLPVNTLDFNQEAMTGKQIAIMQMFPFPGKQGLRENIAREGATVAEYRYRELRNQLVQNVKSIYYDLYFVDRAIEITQKNTGILAEFVQIAETKYSVGTGLQQDVLRAQVEHSKMTDRLIKLQQKRETLEAQLNALLNRPANDPVGPTAALSYREFPLDFAELKAVADTARPLLQAWQATLRQSDQTVKLAKKEYFPDFSLAVAYTQREVLQSGMGGADFVSGMLSVKIPLYFGRKQRRQVEEKQLLKQSVADKYRNIQNQVYAALDATLNEVHNNQRLVELFQTGIIPQASQSLQSAIAGYQTDKVDFLTLLTNQINLFNFEQDYHRILSEYFKGIAKLEALAGTEILK
jgi:outer membrane protein TolC